MGRKIRQGLSLPFHFMEKEKCMSLLKSNTYSINKKNKADGLKLLTDINNETISVAFFDPQYRGILDKMKYGNEHLRMKDRWSLV